MGHSRIRALLLPVLLVSTFVSCGDDDDGDTTTTTALASTTSAAGLANPAAVYCEQSGGVVSGDEPLCELPDGTIVDAWEYYRENNPDAAGHSPEELVDALLTIDDMTGLGIDFDWEVNTRDVVAAPTPPFDGTLDPYLCSEAGVPAVLLLPQAQLELTGGSVMEILIPSDDAAAQYRELDEAYQACTEGTSLAHVPLADGPSVGDESASYRSDLGLVTIARFGSDLMIVKWLTGEFTDDVIDLYPSIVARAAEKLEAV